MVRNGKESKGKGGVEGEMETNMLMHIYYKKVKMIRGRGTEKTLKENTFTPLKDGCR